MVQQSQRLPVYFRGVRIGTLVDPAADMYWWRSRWEPEAIEEARAFRELVAAGEDPQVLVGDERPLRLVATAEAGDELELKPAS